MVPQIHGPVATPCAAREGTWPGWRPRDGEVDGLTDPAVPSLRCESGFMDHLTTKPAPRIVIVVPYYGSWPAFMHPYLESLRLNPLLEVVFVTDLDPFPDSPHNVTYHRLTFAELGSRIREAFEVDVSRLSPYKLCDFRPAYGVLFADLLQQADFWGHGDNDMVFGDVGSVLTPERLDAYDVLSFKKGHLQGPLSVYRNTPRVNELFREGGHYRKAFSTPEYLSFDEFGPAVFYASLNRPEDVARVTSDNISVIAFKEALAGRLRVYCEQHGREALGHRDLLEYRNGHVRDVRTRREYLFYHWVLEKRGIWFRYPEWFRDRPRVFYMSTTGFYSEREYSIYPFVHLWRLALGTGHWLALRAANYVRRRLRRPVVVDAYPRVGWVKRYRAGAP